MTRWMYKLGRLAGPHVRKGRWLWASLTGDEEDVIAAEESVGRDLYRVLCSELQVMPDPELQTWVTQIADPLVRRVKNRRRFHFTVTQVGAPNAFALPGGYVFLTHALLELVRFDPHEVAFVLAHEMSHVVQEHAVERMYADVTLRGLIRAAGGRTVWGEWVKSTGAALLQSAYSRENELEADTLAVRWIKSAGYEPRAAEALFLRLERTMERGSPLAAYFASHPPFPERIEALRPYFDHSSKKRNDTDGT